MVSSQLFLVLFTASNFIFYLNGQYIGTPSSTANTKAVLKHSLDLKCEYTGSDGDGQFLEWYRDNQSVNLEKPGHYVVKTTGKESILTIKIFVMADAEVKEWHVKTSKPGFEIPYQCRFGSIPLKPSPQSIETNQPKEKIDSAHGSIRRNEDETVTFKCIIEPENTDGLNQLKWEYSKDDHTYAALPSDVIQKENELTIAQVKKNDRGFYRCVLNDVKFTVLLRVKDRLAALWPFIGIVGVVLVLVIIILIFEKRQKSTKKGPATDDDDQDQADPLVRTTARSTDNDNPKRAVVA